MQIEPDIHESLCRTASSIALALAQAVERIGPIEIVPSRHPTVADQLFVEVVNQQLSAKAADAIWRRIEAAASAHGNVRALFAPEHEAVLRACGVSRNKVRALGAIRMSEENGLLDGPSLAFLPHEERVARLCSIWGVGRWTADMIGIFYCLDPDIWPEGDVAAVGALRRITGREDTTEVARAFRPYRSLLARYMWLSRGAA